MPYQGPEAEGACPVLMCNAVHYIAKMLEMQGHGLTQTEDSALGYLTRFSNPARDTLVLPAPETAVC